MNEELQCRGFHLPRIPFERSSIIPSLDVPPALDYSCAMLGAETSMLISHAFLLLGLLV
jgi:hypothetical protein